MVSFAASCILDPKKEPEDKIPTPGASFETLKEKDHTLVNLELLFNEFNSSEYDRLLDSDFTFFFSDADFSSANLTDADFSQYRVIKRKPLSVHYHQSRLLTNPACEMELNVLSLKDVSKNTFSSLLLFVVCCSLCTKTRVSRTKNMDRNKPIIEMPIPK